MPRYKDKTIEELPDFLTIGQTAKLLGCHVNTLRNWESEGRLTCIRIGNRRDRRFKKADIIALLITE